MSNVQEWVEEWHEGVRLWMEAEHSEAWCELTDLNQQIEVLLARREKVYDSLPPEVRNTLSMRGAISAKPQAYLLAKELDKPVEEILAAMRENALDLDRERHIE